MQSFYRFGGIFLLLLSIVFPTSAFSNDTRAVNADKDQLVLGLLPYVSPKSLEQRFAPLANYLTRKLDVKIVIETAPSFHEFAKRTAEHGRYDLLFTAPHLYYRARRGSGYRAVVRIAGPPMDAVIVVPKTSEILTLEDLRGRRLAIPAPLSLASLLTREYLATAGADFAANVTLIETPTHNASLSSALQGWTDAASLMGPIFQRLQPDVQAKLKVIGITAGAPRMPISVAPWLTADQAAAFTRTMLEVGNSTEGRALLKQMKWPGIISVQPQDYDFFEKFAAAIDLE